MPIVGQVVEPAVEAVPVMLDQHRERLPIALLRTLDEHVFRLGRSTKLVERCHVATPSRASQSFGTPIGECCRSSHNDCNALYRLLPENPAACSLRIEAQGLNTTR